MILGLIIGAVIGGCLGVIIMAILQIGRDDREDKKVIDRDIDIILESLKMLEALKKAESDNKKQFECPLCGGVVKWYRSKINNHIHLSCDSCGFKIHE